jgi:hypothetical protein
VTATIASVLDRTVNPRRLFQLIGAPNNAITTLGNIHSPCPKAVPLFRNGTWPSNAITNPPHPWYIHSSQAIFDPCRTSNSPLTAIILPNKKP